MAGVGLQLAPKPSQAATKTDAQPPSDLGVKDVDALFRAWSRETPPPAPDAPDGWAEAIRYVPYEAIFVGTGDTFAYVPSEQLVRWVRARTEVRQKRRLALERGDMDTYADMLLWEKVLPMLMLRIPPRTSSRVVRPGNWQ